MMGINRKSKKSIYVLLPVILFFGIKSGFALTVPEFFKKLVSDHREKLNAIFDSGYEELCEDLGISKNHSANREKVIPVFFYHELLTCTSARDGNVGGILKIPYFWHYTQPNLRCSIIYIPTSQYLVKVPPPAGFKLYKSYADADRRPRLYLSDLVSENPKFKHRLCGTFSTFGWCSEREMAFNTLLITLGYECKVYQKGIHVWSEVLVHLRNDRDKVIPVVMRVDNTFDSVSYYVLKKTISRWKSDFGKGSHVKWYNSVSRSEKELEAVRELEVPTRAQERIRTRILIWLKKNVPVPL